MNNSIKSEMDSVISEDLNCVKLFLTAASEGDINYVQKQLALTTTEISNLIFSADQDGNTALHLAAQYGRVEVLNYFIERGANIEATNTNKWAPLHYAARNGHRDVLEVLLANGAQVDIVDCSGMTSLHHAAGEDALDIVDVLLQNGADIKCSDKVGMTALARAAEAGHHGMVTLLMDMYDSRQLDINEVDQNGMSILSHAVKSGNENLIKYLIEKGSDINAVDLHGWSPIYYVVVSGNWDLVKYMIEHGGQITCLTADQKMEFLKHITGTHLDVDHDPDNTMQVAFYKTIPLNRVELFETLFDKWQSDHSDNLLVLQKLDHVLSKVYEGLRLVNVPLSKEMEFTVEDAIINLRFLIGKIDKIGKSVDVSVEDIQSRISMVFDHIGKLEQEYLGSEGSNVDAQFLFTARFIAQNIRVLKRQLQSTYNKIPWEEMEFCVVNFIGNYNKQEGFNAVYTMILDKDRLLRHLINFAKELEKERTDIKRVGANSKFPNFEGQRLSRNVAEKLIVSSCPSFQELYNDHKFIRNVHSLKRIEGYVKLALAVDLIENQEFGMLVIERTLQVIGESLKNTLESPNLSDDIHQLLLDSAPRNLKEILTLLRDSLSHAHTFSNKINLEYSRNIHFFSNVKNDLRKLEVELVEILYRMKIEAIQFFLTKIIKSAELEEIKLLANSLSQMKIEDIDLEHDQTVEIVDTKMLIDELENKIKVLSDEEKQIFNEINRIMVSQVGRLPNIKNTYKSEFKRITYVVSQIINCHSVETIHNFCHIHLNYKKEQLQARKYSDIKHLLSKMLSYIDQQNENGESKNDEYLLKILRPTSNIVCNIEFKAERINGINTFKEMLEQRETEQLTKAQEVVDNFILAIETNLTFEEDKNNFRQELAKAKILYDTKLELSDLFKQLGVESISKDDNSVKQRFDDLVKILGLGKAKKKELDKQISESKWNSCLELIRNIRSSYQTFLESVRKSLDDKKSIDLSQKLKDFVRFITKNRVLLDKIDAAIHKYAQKNKDQFESYFDARLEILKSIITDYDKFEFIKKYKQNKEFQLVIEMLTLDLLEILETTSVSCNNRLYFDSYTPLLCGKNLRNYLAHGDPLVDTLPFDSSIAIVSAALKFIKEGQYSVTKDNMLGVKQVEYDSSNLNNQYTQHLSLLVNQKKMYFAAKSGHLEKVKKYIGQVELKCRNINGWTGMHFAAEGDSIPIIKLFLDKSLSIHEEDEYGQSPCHVAATSGSIKTLEFLIQENRLNAFLIDHHKLLYCAARAGRQDIVRALLAKGANVDEETKHDAATPLQVAAQMGHTEVVAVLLENGANIAAQTEKNITPFHFAVEYGHPDVVMLLIEKGSDVGAPFNSHNRTPLHAAAERGHLEVVRILLEKGATVDAPAEKNQTPLHVSALFGHLDIVVLLLEKGAKCDAQNTNNWTPLHCAAVYGHKNVVEVLMAKGSTVDYICNNKITPLHLAAQEGHLEIVALLLTKNATVNALTIDNYTPLHYAVMSGHQDITNLLLVKGARVNAQINDCLTPLHVAAQQGHQGLAALLLAEGANANSCDKDNATPLHMAAVGGHENVVELLLMNKGDANALTKSNWTPLHYASQNGHQDVVALLLERCVNANILNNDHRSPLHLAAQNGHKKVVLLLLSHSRDKPDSLGKFWSPLHSAVQKGHRDVIYLLLANAANVDAQNDDDMTPLHLAAHKGFHDIVILLLDKGADVNAQTEKEKLTPLHYAAQNGHQDVVKELLSRGANIGAQDIFHGTPLHLAALSGHLSVVSVLLDKNANPDSFTKGKDTPLLLAARRGFLEVVTALLDKGANINPQTIDAVRPLHLSAEEGHQSVVEILLARGAEVNATDNTGWSPLHFAARSGHHHIVRVLLECGADILATDTDGETPLHWAARNGFSDVVEVLLRGGAQVDAQDNRKLSPIDFAALEGHLNVVEKLVSGNVNVNISDMYGQTPLHYAIEKGHLNMVKLLVAHGANVDALDQDNWTPLLYATQKDHQEIVETLLENGANLAVSLVTDNVTPLHYAAQNGNKNIVDVLLAKGATVDALNNDNWTPLHYAIQCGHLDVVESLLAKGANVEANQNTNHDTPLHLAAVGGYKDVVALLLAHDAHVDSLSKYDETPLHGAAQNGHQEVVAMLIEHGANFNARCIKNVHPLHLAATNGHVNVVSELLMRGATADVVDGNKWTPLHYAAQTGHKHVVELLLAKDATVDALEIDGETALHYAASEGHRDVVDALIVHGANVYARSKDNWTPLHYAASEGHLDVADVLISKYTHVDMLDKEGMTPLHYSAKHGHVNVVELLIGKGANVDAINKDNLTPLHYAEQKCHRDVVKMLIMKGATVIAQDGHKESQLQLLKR